MRLKINKVAGLRAMLGLSQKELSKLLGISSQSYSNKETGKTSFSDKEKIKLKNIFIVIDDSLTIEEIFFS